jgi:hypothetical protein
MKKLTTICADGFALHSVISRHRGNDRDGRREREREETEEREEGRKRE